MFIRLHQLHQKNKIVTVDNSYSTCWRPVFDVSSTVDDGVIVSVVGGSEWVARAQATEVRALRWAAHAHAADEPAPRTHYLAHRRCKQCRNINNYLKSYKEHGNPNLWSTYIGDLLFSQCQFSDLECGQYFAVPGYLIALVPSRRRQDELGRKGMRNTILPTIK